MDDLAHDFPLNHRKRKADPEDHKDNPSSDTVAISPPLVDTSSTSNTGPSNAPRHPWLPSNNDSPIWSPSSSQPSSPLSSEVIFTYPPKPTKRPRLQRIETSLRHNKRYPPSPRKSAILFKPFPSRPSPLRHGNDIEDIGIVSTADPGPSTGSLLHLRPNPKSTDSPSPPVPPFIPLDIGSTHIPSMQPLINRQTLKELDLDAILRNPQLRACTLLLIAKDPSRLILLVLLPLYPSLQATIYSSIPVFSFDRPAAVENATCQKSIGRPSYKKSKLGVLAYLLTTTGSPIYSSVLAHKSQSLPLVLSSLILPP
jgi:hypothetical protein